MAAGLTADVALAAALLVICGTQSWGLARQGRRSYVNADVAAGMPAAGRFPEVAAGVDVDADMTPDTSAFEAPHGTVVAPAALGMAPGLVPGETLDVMLGLDPDVT